MWDLLRELSFWFIMASPMMAGFKKNSPGCKCCGGCQFFSDDFAVDDLATNYTSVSGSWAISGGNLHTASSTAILTGSTANPNSDANTKVSVTVNIGTSSDIARIILAYQNSSNYWFAEVKAGLGAYLKIYQRSSGTDTQKATVSITRAVASDFVFCASIYNGVISTSVGPTNVESLSYSATFSNTGWGLGTGTLAGTVTFDALSVSVTSVTCPACGTYCSTCCLNSVAPSLMKLVVGSVANAGCTDCANLNGTYYLAQSGSCFYRFDGTVTICGTSSQALATTLSICNFINGVANFDWIFTYNITSVRYTKAFTTNYDCNSWVDEQPTTAVLTDGINCDWSSATKKITSVV